MSDESRLGREQIATADALQQITDAGVRVFFYLEDQERTMGTATDKLISTIKNFGGSSNARRPARASMTRCSGKRKRSTSWGVACTGMTMWMSWAQTAPGSM